MSIPRLGSLLVRRANGRIGRLDTRPRDLSSHDHLHALSRAVLWDPTWSDHGPSCLVRSMNEVLFSVLLLGTAVGHGGSLPASLLRLLVISISGQIEEFSISTPSDSRSAS
jgi:hypothetical protein